MELVVYDLILFFLIIYQGKNNLTLVKDTRLSIIFSSGTYYLDDLNDDSSFIDQEIINYFDIIDLKGVNEYSTVFIQDDTNNKSFISIKNNEQQPTRSTNIYITVYSLIFKNWGNSGGENNNNNAIFQIYNNDFIRLYLSFNLFENIINRQIVFIENNEKINGNQYISIGRNDFRNIYSNLNIPPPIQLHDISSMIYNNNFNNCSTSSASFISSINNNNNNYYYVYSQFSENIIQLSTTSSITAWISVSNSYFEITKSNFDFNTGRLISFNSNQLQNNENNYLLIQSSNFNQNKIISNDEGSLVLINGISSSSSSSSSSNSNSEVVASRIINCFFLKTNHNNQSINSIIKLNSIKSLQVEQTSIGGGGGDEFDNDNDNNNIAFSSFNSNITIIKSIMKTNKPMIGNLSNMFIIDSTISNDHSKFSQCLNCIFDYTSSTNPSLNWKIITSSNSNNDNSNNSKKVAIIVSSIVVPVVVVLLIVILSIILIKSKKQKHQKQNNETKMNSFNNNNQAQDNIIRE